MKNRNLSIELNMNEGFSRAFKSQSLIKSMLNYGEGSGGLRLMCMRRFLFPLMACQCSPV
ncbi:MAG: hypothetical protein D3904_16515 [Candidatus Electrothrix sp. EH2]|nr:hypothetical protein [Candidatus Electrothrix sp. EH2]